MKMKVGICGIGLGISKLSIGANLISVGYLWVMPSPATGRQWTFRIHDKLSIGPQSQTFLMSGVATEWFYVEPDKYDWMYNHNWLLGKIMEIEVDGLAFKRGTADVSVKLFDENKEEKTITKKCCIKTEGGQIAAAKVRGVVERGPLDSHFQRITYYPDFHSKKNRAAR